MLKMYSKTAANCIIFHQYGNYSLSGGMYVQYIPSVYQALQCIIWEISRTKTLFENTPLNHNIHTTVFPWCKLDLITYYFKQKYLFGQLIRVYTNRCCWIIWVKLIDLTFILKHTYKVESI